MVENNSLVAAPRAAAGILHGSRALQRAGLRASTADFLHRDPTGAHTNTPTQRCHAVKQSQLTYEGPPELR